MKFNFLDFLAKWWGLIVLGILGLVLYLEWIVLPPEFPTFLVTIGIIIVWVFFTFVYRGIKGREQSYTEAANNFDSAISELNDLFSKKKDTEWKELSKITDYGVHGTKQNKLWKLTYRKQGKTFVGKIDPKSRGKDSIVYAGRSTVMFKPTIMESDANLESLKREYERMKDVLRYKRGPPKKTKIKLEQTEEDYSDEKLPGET